jgi:hypothetical protein
LEIKGKFLSPLGALDFCLPVAALVSKRSFIGSETKRSQTEMKRTERDLLERIKGKDVKGCSALPGLCT